MKLWIARNINGKLVLFEEKPYVVDGDWGTWRTYGNYMVIDKNMFPEVTFKNSPQKVELKLIEK
jgi:hypothetical protein